MDIDLIIQHYESKILEYRLFIKTLKYFQRSDNQSLNSELADIKFPDANNKSVSEGLKPIKLDSKIPDNEKSGFDKIYHEKIKSSRLSHEEFDKLYNEELEFDKLYREKKEFDRLYDRLKPVTIVDDRLNPTKLDSKILDDEKIYLDKLYREEFDKSYREKIEFDKLCSEKLKNKDNKNIFLELDVAEIKHRDDENIIIRRMNEARERMKHDYHDDKKQIPHLTSIKETKKEISIDDIKSAADETKLTTKEVEPSPEEISQNTITPLYKLSHNAREKLLENIYNESKKFIKENASAGTDSETLNSLILDEANKRLDVWMETNA